MKRSSHFSSEKADSTIYYNNLQTRVSQERLKRAEASDGITEQIVSINSNGSVQADYKMMADKRQNELSSA